jgi:hypothetical protein
MHLNQLRLVIQMALESSNTSTSSYPECPQPPKTSKVKLKMMFSNFPTLPFPHEQQQSEAFSTPSTAMIKPRPTYSAAFEKLIIPYVEPKD